MESLIASCKESAVWGMNVFLTTFSFVPDDKLNWTPAPTAKGAMRIAAHTAEGSAEVADQLLVWDDIVEAIINPETPELVWEVAVYFFELFTASID
jgi:hypothetical protein